MKKVAAVGDLIEPIYVAIGKRVLEERHRAGWTQQDLCGQIGLNRTSIANIELGRQRLMLHQIVALADVFDVSVADMIGEAVKDARETQPVRAENVRLRRRVAELEGRLARVASIAAPKT